MRHRKSILLFIACFTVLNGYWLTGLQFDFDMEQLFPKHDVDLDFYQKNLSGFQSDKQYLIVGIETQQGIFNQDFLTRLSALTDMLDSTETIVAASSLCNISYYVIDARYRLRTHSFVHPDNPTSYESDSLFLEGYEDVREKFVSADRNAVTLYLELSSDLPQSQHAAFLTELRELLTSYGFTDYHFTGAIDTETSYVEKLKSELVFLFSLSLLFILIVLYLYFRSRWGVLIPFGIILLTVCWTLGTMTACGVPIHTLTVIIPSIITIVSLSDVIHLMSRYHEELAVGLPGTDAMERAIKDIGVAILLTSLTTALGFLTLSFADIQPFIEFGIFTAIGVIYAWFLTIYLLPYLLDRTNAQFSVSHLSSDSFHWVRNGLNITQSSPYLICGIGIFLLSISLMGISHLQINSYLYEELSSDDEYSESLNFFDQQFSGIRPVEVYVEVLDNEANILSLSHLHKIDSLEMYLREEYGVLSLYSINTQIKRMHRSLKRGRSRHFMLPKDSSDYDLIIHALDSAYTQMELQTILSPSYRSTLIAGKINDLGSHIISQRNAALTLYLEKLFPPDQYLTRITGKALLLDKSNEVIAYNLGMGLLTALLAVAILMGFLFRSILIAFIALIPNILPLLFVAGLMGWMDIGLKMSTAIIYTIAFGIAVDDTIHFLSRFRSELKKATSIDSALSATYLSTGKAILTTSIILVLGFGILLFSEFNTTFQTGLFVSLSLLFAVFADLLLLPILLRWLGRAQAQKRSGGGDTGLI